MNQTATAEKTEHAEVVQMTELVTIKEFGIQEITKANLDLMEKQILEVPATPENKEQYDKVYRYHVDSKDLLPKIEKRRVKLKAPVLEKGRNIDATAKKAKEIIQPLIELAGDRRFAWEKIAEDKKAAEEKIEADRLAMINGYMRSLEHDCAPLEYGMNSQQITGEIRFLEMVEISAVDYDTRTEEAEAILQRAIADATMARTRQIAFELEREAAAKLAAKNKADADALAEKTKAFEAQQAQAAADQKNKADAAALIATQEAKKTRKANEKLKAERLALDKEKAKILSDKLDAEEKAYAAIWDEAHKINMITANDSAIAFNAFFDTGWIRAQEIDRAIEKDLLKKNKVRAGLIKKDKANLKSVYDIAFKAFTDLTPYLSFETAEAEDIFTDFKSGFKQPLCDLSAEIESLA